MHSKHQGRDKSIISLLRASYGVKEVFDRHDSFISRYIYRPVSFYLAVPFVWLGFSANQVTLLSFVVALVGMGLLATGNQPAVLIGSLLRATGVLLDYVDGDIARLQGKTSHLGKFLDGMTDTLIGALLPLAVSLGLYSKPDRILAPLSSQVDPGLIWVVGASISVTTCLGALLIFRLRAASLEIQLQKGGEIQTKPLASGDQVRSWPKPLRWVLVSLKYGIRTEAYFMLIGIVLFAALDVMSVYVAIRCVACSLSFALALVRALVQAYRDLDVYRAY
jgi:phosphatidylglycerophosphate synthase